MNAPETTVRGFTTTQKEYLQGFAAGIAAAGALPFVGRDSAGKIVAAAAPGIVNEAEATWYGWPLDEITREEAWKREQNPLDIWDRLLAHARDDAPPQPEDVYRFKFHGLFYVAPAQDSFMVRVRIPGNALTSVQMRALAAIAAELGGGYGDVTTRGNVQIRELRPRHIVEVLTRLADVGLSSRGAGADNIRNVTASPLAGIDATELVDTRPLARALQHYIANQRDLFGLPRKFNVSFDGGGRVSVVAGTNDIGFVASRLRDGDAGEVGFRVLLAGITGHERFAEDCGLLVAPADCVAVAAAMIRVFAELGDRTDRKRARLCYLLDRIGVPKYLDLVQEKLGFALRRVAADACLSRPPVDKHGHLGVHPQGQPGLRSLGLAVPVGRMDAGQMRGLAEIAERFGTGELRTTVWQNVIVPHVAEEVVAAALDAVGTLGLDVGAPPFSAGLVACTGNTGCRFSATDTKGQALALARELQQRVAVNAPVNIHLTGCPHSCAQHYIGDIGLLGTQVATTDGPVEGYHVFVGGGVEQERGLAREIATGVPFGDLADRLARLFAAFKARRAPGETFVAFARRHDVDTLRSWTTVPVP